MEGATSVKVKISFVVFLAIFAYGLGLFIPYSEITEVDWLAKNGNWIDTWAYGVMINPTRTFALFYATFFFVGAFTGASDTKKIKEYCDSSDTTCSSSLNERIKEYCVFLIDVCLIFYLIFLLLLPFLHGAAYLTASDGLDAYILYKACFKMFLSFACGVAGFVFSNSFSSFKFTRSVFVTGCALSAVLAEILYPKTFFASALLLVLMTTIVFCSEDESDQKIVNLDSGFAVANFLYLPPVAFFTIEVARSVVHLFEYFGDMWSNASVIFIVIPSVIPLFVGFSFLKYVRVAVVCISSRTFNSEKTQQNEQGV